MPFLAMTYEALNRIRFNKKLSKKKDCVIIISLGDRHNNNLLTKESSNCS